ncbi:MAG: type II toxin-antitoxin system Phd/YefM family antitoxin [Alphaproteobacteria bacterium]|nr:type II toxin-antitoxin system Phd/YefM family antitoxin [Alphaproteobacteria bacterium]
MNSIVSAIKNTVSISLFNKGLAGKIFSELKTTGPKVVMKNNTAEAVLLSPDEYVEMMDAINDYNILSEAIKRMNNFDPTSLTSFDKIKEKFHINPEDLEAIEEVEFE